MIRRAGAVARPASRVLGTGSFVPPVVRSNVDLEKLVDTNDDWIRERTGIRERRIAPEGMVTSDMAAEAAKLALAKAEIDAKQLDLVIVATVTPDMPMPATAVFVQQKIGAACPAFDLSAACAGFIYGLTIADQFVRSGAAKHVLVIGVELLSRVVNWGDRTTCVLFGDGAGAAVVGPCDTNEGLLASATGTDGSGVDLIVMRAGGTRTPVTAEAIEQKLNRISMRGAEVYKFAVRTMGDITLEALAKAGLSSADVDLFVPHQANIRIIEAASQRIGIPPDKVFVNVDRYGNTSAASIPIALCEALDAGRVKRGDVLVFVGFGAGLTCGANVVRWCRSEPRQ